MNQSFAQMASLADSLVNRVDELEQENAELTEHINMLIDAGDTLCKQAGYDLPEVPESVIDTTIGCFVKVGALNPSQTGAARAAMLEDPCAVHRAIQGILEAQSQHKTASYKDSDDMSLYGGTLASGIPERPEMDNCLDRMERILGMV